MSDALAKLDEVRKLVIEGDVRLLGLAVVTASGQYFALDMEECDMGDLARGVVAARMLEEAVMHQVGAYNADDPCVCDDCESMNSEETLN